MLKEKLGKVIKKRPRIRLRVPRTVAPGETFVAKVHLNATREVDIQYVDVSLVGAEGWVHGESSAAREVCRLGVRASTARTLPRGSTELTVKCTIPEHAPASYAGTAAYVRYRVDVHVHLSWWPDARASFVVQVRTPEEQAGEGVPRIYTTNTSGPKGTDPHVECSLATDAVEPGGEVIGNITLYNVEHNPYRDVLLSLIARERLLHANGAQAGHADSRFSSKIAISPRYDGEAHAFRLKIPDAASPARRQRMWRLEWLFEVEARARRSATLRFPLRMLPSVIPPESAVRLAPPTIGQERIASHWISVGERRGFSFANMALKQTRTALEIEIQREHRGEDGTFLVARFTYPSLGLEVEAGPKRGLRRLMGGADIGEGEFAKKHYATGREDRQISDLIRRLRPTLERFQLEHLDDTRLEIAREGSGHSEQALEHFVLDVVSVIEAWEQTRRELVAPKAMRDARDSWARLARRLDGRFDAGDMSIHGKLDGAPVELTTEWKGTTPQRTVVQLTIDESIDADLRFACDIDEWSSGDPDQLSGEARALVQQLVGEPGTWLTVEESRLELELDGAEPDAAELLQQLRRLAALSALLRTHAGPYR